MHRLREAEMEKLFIKGHLQPNADISAKNIESFLKQLSAVCKMQIFFGPVVKTPDYYDEDTFKRLGNRKPRDVNAVIMWTDSGVQMYIFPEKDNWITIDIYSCKKFDKNDALKFIIRYFDFENDVQYATQTADSFSQWITYKK